MISAKILPLLIRYKYPLIIPLAFVEGPIIMMMCGFLIKLGYMSFLPAYFVLMAGDLLGDIFWYSLGFFYGEAVVRKFGRFLSIEEKEVATVKRIFHQHHTTILLVSKITMGFGFALVTLITAGIVKIPFRRYLAFNFFGQFVWTGILMSVGFFLGKFYLTINDVLGKVSIFALFIIIALCLFGFGKYIKKKVNAKYIS